MEHLHLTHLCNTVIRLFSEILLETYHVLFLKLTSGLFIAKNSRHIFQSNFSCKKTISPYSEIAKYICICNMKATNVCNFLYCIILFPQYCKTSVSCTLPVPSKTTGWGGGRYTSSWVGAVGPHFSPRVLGWEGRGLKVSGGISPPNPPAPSYAVGKRIKHRIKS